MFISNNERIQLRKDIEALAKIVGDMNAEILYLKAKVKALAGATKEQPKKRTMSPEARAKISRMMKERHAKQKMEKQNGNSVSTKSK